MPQRMDPCHVARPCLELGATARPARRGCDPYLARPQAKTEAKKSELEDDVAKMTAKIDQVLRFSCCLILLAFFRHACDTLPGSGSGALSHLISPLLAPCRCAESRQPCSGSLCDEAKFGRQYFLPELE
jgi:hypothetical protein